MIAQNYNRSTNVAMEHNIRLTVNSRCRFKYER